MKSLLALPLSLLLMGAAPPSVVVANGDWSNLPHLAESDDGQVSVGVMQRIYDLAAKRQCALPGFRDRRLDFDISFAVGFHPDGSVEKLVFHPLNCPEAEMLVGAQILAMIQKGELRQTGANLDRWYQGRLSFDFSA